MMDNKRTEKRDMMRKLLTICPECQQQIYGFDLNLSDIDKSKVGHWPLSYVYCHSHNEGPMHALTMYLDATYTVRSREVSNNITIQK